MSFFWKPFPAFLLKVESSVFKETKSGDRSPDSAAALLGAHFSVPPLRLNLFTQMVTAGCSDQDPQAGGSAFWAWACEGAAGWEVKDTIQGCGKDDDPAILFLHLFIGLTLLSSCHISSILLVLSGEQCPIPICKAPLHLSALPWPSLALHSSCPC